MGQNIGSRYVSASMHNYGNTPMFVLFWGVITLFDERETQSLDLSGQSTSIRTIELLCISIVMIFWILNSESPNMTFGVKSKTSRKNIVQNLWKVSLGFALLIQYPYFENSSSTLQWFILVPLIIEVPFSLKYRNEPSKLNFEFWKPANSSYQSSYSLIRSFVIILALYLGEWITGKIWLLILLGWISLMVIGSISITGFSIIKYIENKKKNSLQAGIADQIRNPETRMTLYGILKNLQATDYRNMYIVKGNKTFKTNKGKIKPIKGLLILPVDLSQFNFYQSDEILLIGFGPKSSKSNARVVLSSGVKDGEYYEKSILAGTLTLAKKDWDKILPQLHKITEDEDLSDYDALSPSELEDKIRSFNESWVNNKDEIRDAAHQFIEKFLGTEDIDVDADVE